MKRRSAFTLIELLVVIAIIAILAVVVVLTLNPTQLLAQSRDANRVSELATMNSAISLFQTDTGGRSSLGIASTTYLSLPDPAAASTSTNCSGLGSPNLSTSTYFSCGASSTYRSVNGTGWIPLNFTAISAGSPFGSLPVDPVNQTSSNLYYSYQTDGNTFRLVATPESQKYQQQAAQNPQMFTSGSNPNLYGTWIPVPGNSTFNTGNFMVMKYDASCVNRTTGAPLTSPLDGTAVNGYNNGGNGVNGNNCSYANGFAPASIATGYPIVDVSQTQAAQYCAQIGAHLITNNEWQTIAWNLENNPANWYGGTVGTNYIYSGHNDNYPPNALVADPNDANGYAGETNQGGNQRRTLTLGNGAVIWDMAGNLWQWTNDTITGANQPTGATPGFTWREFTAITTWGTMTQQTAGPANSTWDHTKGIGEIYSDGTPANNAIYGFLRGGSWGNGASDGVGALNLDNGPGITIPYIGFRCAR